MNQLWMHIFNVGVVKLNVIEKVKDFLTNLIHGNR